MSYKHTNFYVIIFNAGYSKHYTFQNKNDADTFERGFYEASEYYGGNPSIYVYPCDKDIMMEEEDEALDALTAIGNQ